ncbi:restriction endonuclease [Bradyrhizobium sp. vgs-9]|uniref:restriction endonuclease n=1 Tax=Bradyrhizobium sp. vgs-9 TaxID=208389 RepID=UPI0035D41548
MTSLFALAKPVFPGMDHVYVTSDSGEMWSCFGSGTGGTMIAQVADANIDAVRAAAGRDGAAGIVYGISGLQYQVANRLLRAGHSGQGDIQKVSNARGYRAAALAFGEYGRTLFAAPKRPERMEDVVPDTPIKDLALLFGSSPPPKEIVEARHALNKETIEYIKRNPNAVFSLSSREFEYFVAELLSSFGFEVELTPATKDGGYDLFAVSTDAAGLRANWIVECKKYSQERKVGVEIVRALYGVKSANRVGNALIATTSQFTKGAKDFKLSRYDLELRDYEGIVDWLDRYKQSPAGLYVPHNKLILPGKEPR